MWAGRPPALSLAGGRVRARFPGAGRLHHPRQRGEVLHFFANHELLALELMALVLLARRRVREAFGPQIAYALWALPLLRLILPPLPRGLSEQATPPLAAASERFATYVMVPVTEQLPPGLQRREQLLLGLLEPADVAVGVPDDRAHGGLDLGLPRQRDVDPVDALVQEVPDGHLAAARRIHRAQRVLQEHVDLRDLVRLVAGLPVEHRHRDAEAGEREQVVRVEVDSAKDESADDHRAADSQALA